MQDITKESVLESLRNAVQKAGNQTCYGKPTNRQVDFFYYDEQPTRLISKTSRDILAKDPVYFPFSIIRQCSLTTPHQLLGLPGVVINKNNLAAIRWMQRAGHEAVYRDNYWCIVALDLQQFKPLANQLSPRKMDFCEIVSTKPVVATMRYKSWYINGDPTLFASCVTLKSTFTYGIRSGMLLDAKGKQLANLNHISKRNKEMLLASISTLLQSIARPASHIWPSYFSKFTTVEHMRFGSTRVAKEMFHQDTVQGVTWLLNELGQPIDTIPVNLQKIIIPQML